MLTRSSLGIGIALLLALPACEQLLGLSHLQRPCDRRSCAGLCGLVDDGCGGSQDCGSCAVDGGVAADAGAVDAGAVDAGAAGADAGAPACDDDSRNGLESDVDCGGPECPGCGVGMRCDRPEDCGSGLCESNECQPAPTCSDREPNGTETDRDCGGPACAGCATGMVCVVHDDCLSETCIFGICRDPTCSDAVRNQDEADVDCGGSCPKKCADGRRCAGGGDCTSGQCATGFCAPSCAVSNGGCDPSATCSNEPSGRTCTCMAGYTGDGLRCTDVDECQVNRGGCDPNATCTNTPGSRVCECKAGYTGDGLTCTATFPPNCSSNNGGCDPNATCTQGPFGVICTCKAGYAGNGRSCSPVCRRPKVMIAVDRSASMMQSLESALVLCTDVNGDYLPTSPNDCKWKDLRSALTGSNGLLATTRGAAFYGLAAFPGSDQPNTCAAGGEVVDLSDAGDNVDAIGAALVKLVPAGGTPTAVTLEKLARNAQLQSSNPNQARIVLLITDGIPNCNVANKAICEECKARGCSDGVGLNECTACFADPCKATFQLFSDTSCEALNACLDGSNMVAAVSALAAKGIKTFVIGFGAETSSGDAAAILSQAAVAGGLARDASAPTRFYQASTTAELEQALATFAASHVRPCTP